MSFLTICRTAECCSLAYIFERLCKNLSYLYCVIHINESLIIIGFENYQFESSESI